MKLSSSQYVSPKIYTAAICLAGTCLLAARPEAPVQFRDFHWDKLNFLKADILVRAGLQVEHFAEIVLGEVYF